jgi:hypothetical protein
MNGPSQLDNVDCGDPAIYESIRNRKFDPYPLLAPNDKPLEEFRAISYYWSEALPERIHVLVGTPVKMSPVTLATDQNTFAPAVTLCRASRGCFERPNTVEQNNIHKLDGTEPDFLTEFRTKLEQPRWIKSGTEVCFFRSHIPSSY